MATCALTSDRRAFLAAAPVAVAALSLTAAAAPLMAHGRHSWEAALAAHERAKAEDAAFDPVYWRIHEVWEAGKPSMASIHWKEFTFADRDHVARTLDLESTWQKFLAGQGKWWSARDPEAVKARHRAALDSVQAFRDAEAQHNRESGMGEADERWGKLAEANCEAQRMLMDMPAPDLAALGWKLARLRDDDGGLVAWEADYIRQTFADIDRLLPKGA
jgi:hypothetical protein